MKVKGLGWNRRWLEGTPIEKSGCHPLSEARNSRTKLYKSLCQAEPT